MSTSGLARHLVKEGFLTDSDCQLIARDHSNTGAAFAKVVVALGILSEEKLAHYLKEKTKFPMIPHKEVCSTRQDAEGSISLPLLQALEVVPLELNGDTLTVAMADPLDQNTLQQLKFFTPYKIKPTIATFSSLYLSLENLIQGFSAQKTTLEKFLAHHKLAVPSAAKKRPIEGASAKSQAPQVANDDLDDADDEDYDSYDDFNDEESNATSSIDDIDVEDNDSDVLGDSAEPEDLGSTLEDSLQGEELSTHGGSATWDEPQANSESMVQAGADAGEDVDFWDEVEGSDETPENTGQTESLSAGQVELWDDDAPASESSANDSTEEASLQPGGGQLWDDDGIENQESPATASSQEEDDLDLWSALEEGSDQSSKSESDDSASEAVLSQEDNLEGAEIPEDELSASQEKEEELESDVFSGDEEINFEDEEGIADSGASNEEPESLELESAEEFAENLEEVSSGSENEELSFEDEVSDFGAEEGEIGEEAGLTDELAASSVGEVDLEGMEDELSDLGMEEGEIGEEAGLTEELAASSVGEEDLESMEDELSDIGSEAVQKTSENFLDDSTTGAVSENPDTLVDLENFDELQSMETQTIDADEGLSNLGDELTSLDDDDVELGQTEQEDISLFDDDGNDLQEASVDELYAPKQDLAIGYLNHGIAATSLAFTPVRAKEAARTSLVKAGIPRGLILSLEDESLSYLTHWNEDESDLDNEIQAIKLSFEDFPGAEENSSLWLDLEKVPDALNVLCRDSSHKLRVHWGEFSKNSSGVTVASWSDRAFHGEQLEVLSAKLVDQLARKVKK